MKVRGLVGSTSRLKAAQSSELAGFSAACRLAAMASFAAETERRFSWRGSWVSVVAVVVGDGGGGGGCGEGVAVGAVGGGGEVAAGGSAAIS